MGVASLFGYSNKIYSNNILQIFDDFGDYLGQQRQKSIIHNKRLKLRVGRYNGKTVTRKNCQPCKQQWRYNHINNKF